MIIATEAPKTLKTAIADAAARELIKEAEGFAERPVEDTDGTLVIGYGHNLQRGRPITPTTAEVLLEQDLIPIYLSLNKKLPQWREWPALVQAVLVDMAYNLGVAGVMKFKQMLAAIEEGDPERAHAAIMHSRYAQQVPSRARRNARLIARALHLARSEEKTGGPKTAGAHRGEKHHV